MFSLLKLLAFNNARIYEFRNGESRITVRRAIQVGSILPGLLRSLQSAAHSHPPTVPALRLSWAARSPMIAVVLFLAVCLFVHGQSALRLECIWIEVFELWNTVRQWFNQPLLGCWLRNRKSYKVIAVLKSKRFFESVDFCRLPAAIRSRSPFFLTTSVSNKVIWRCQKNLWLVPVNFGFWTLLLWNQFGKSRPVEKVR